MSTRIVHRPARLHKKIKADKPIEIAAVPTIRGGGGGGVLMALMPIVGGAGMVMMMMSSGNPIRMAIGSVMIVVVLFTAVGAFARNRTGKRKQAEDDRVRFIEHLGQVEEEIRERAQTQRSEALMRNPAPEMLADVVRDPYRIWERRRGDEDFLITRIGSGIGELATHVFVKPTNDPMAISEPIAQAHLDRMLRRTRTIEGLPMSIPARGVISLVGPLEQTTAAVRSIVLQAAVFHAPDDLRIHVAQPYDGDWLLWLPHILSPELFDGPIGKREVSHDEESATELVEEITSRVEELAEKSKYREATLDRPFFMVIVDMDTPHGKWVAGQLSALPSVASGRMVLLAMSSSQYLEPSHVDVRVLLEDDNTFEVQLLSRGEIEEPAEGEEGYVERMLYGGRKGTLDIIPISLAEAITRQLSPLRLVEDATPDAPLEQTIALDAMLGIQDFATYSIEDAWKPRSTEDFLNVPYGIDSEAKPIKLDIKESAKNGMGPHGLCVGATGSGKSEVLRTLVLSQVICHPPDQLSLVLVDFKGGATFAGLEPLPHTAAIVDNLEDAAGLVDRLHDSILGEIQRRQRVLQAAGNLANVGEYNELRNQGKVTDPLPVLFVVIDEFGELLAAKPEFVDLFVQIGRIGRSIGVHLLLASQRLEEGRLKGLESYLSYRIGLRTFSAQESRSAIGSTAAHELPPIPGSGYLKVDPEIFERFKAAYVSGPYEAAAGATIRELPPVPMPLELANTTEAWLSRKEELHRTQLEMSAVAPKTDKTTLDLVVSRLTTAAEKTRQIWLPPLPEHLSFDGVLTNIDVHPDTGLGADREGYLHVPMGIKDKPLTQWQGPMVLDLAGAGGNVAILGAPQTGKTTALRSLILGAALTHTPHEVNFYIVDMSGSAFGYLAQLPHVGDVVTRFDEDKLRRTIAEMEAFLHERETLFERHQISSVQQMRDMHVQGRLPELFAADVFLVIDGWGTMRKDYDDLAETVEKLAQRGLGYGIHIIFGTGRWPDFRLPVQAVIGTKVEFRLNDSLDSCVAKRVNEKLANETTGRCITSDELISQVALPIMDNPSLVHEATPEALVSAINQAWEGRSAPAVRMLPELITYRDLIHQHQGHEPALVGIAESNLSPVHFNLNRDQRHLIVIGDSQTGKTSFLKNIIAEVCRGKKSRFAVFGIVDLRRSLLGFLTDDDPQFGGYAGMRAGVTPLVEGIKGILDSRLPPDNVTVEQLKNRSWWSGPETYLVIDDFDMIEGSGNPLKPLVPYLPQSEDLGLHIIVARRSAGVSRSSYDPVMQGLREAGANGILLSGDRQEGSVWPKVFLKKLPPGRAQWVTRSGKPQMVQLAFYDQEGRNGL